MKNRRKANATSVHCAGVFAALRKTRRPSICREIASRRSRLCCSNCFLTWTEAAKTEQAPPTAAPINAVATEINTGGFVHGDIEAPFYHLRRTLPRPTTRCYTRLTNAFSKKIENDAAAVALTYFAYNFICIRGTLRISPPMAAGVTNEVWEVSDLIALWEEYERRGERTA